MTILADRGFGDVKLFELLESLGFGYVIRFRGNVHVTAADGQTRLAADWVGKAGQARLLRGAELTAARHKVGAAVCVHAKGMKEAWHLAASDATASVSEIVNLYAKRWTIEPGFRDTKDLRFGMGMSVLRGSIDLFGNDTKDKFQSAHYEIDEAGNCLALGRSSASVFHLMRIMEIGLSAVAKCLQITDPVKPAERNWGSILRFVREAINAKWPTAADRMTGDGALFEAIYASLDAVKNPWRNATMHVENKYTDEEAEDIFLAVKSFMKKLSSRCDENGDPQA